MVTATGAGQRIYVVVVALAFEKLVTFVASMLKTPVLENLTDSAFAADVPITPIAVYRTPPRNVFKIFSIVVCAGSGRFVSKRDQHSGLPSRL